LTATASSKGVDQPALRAPKLQVEVEFPTDDRQLAAFLSGDSL